MKALLDGYQHPSLVDTRTTLALIHPDELRLLMAGKPTIDRAKLAASLRFKGYPAGSQLPKFFRELILSKAQLPLRNAYRYALF
jgi:hypothetical protein